MRLLATVDEETNGALEYRVPDRYRQDSQTLLAIRYPWNFNQTHFLYVTGDSYGISRVGILLESGVSMRRNRIMVPIERLPSQGLDTFARSEYFNLFGDARETWQRFLQYGSTMRYALCITLANLYVYANPKMSSWDFCYFTKAYSADSDLQAAEVLGSDFQRIGRLGDAA